jgi:hypothetical protein
MTVGLTANNPGDIQNAYQLGFQGATPQSIGAQGGAQITVFDNLPDGIRALAVDIGTAINNGYNTLSALVYHYLGTSSNNAQNSNVQGYLTSVEQNTGLSVNSTISSANVPTLVSAIINAEGNSSGVSQSALQQGLSAAGYGSSSVTGSSNINLGTVVSGEYNNFTAGLQSIFQNPVGSASYLVNNAASGTAASIANPQGAASYLLGQFNSGASTLGQATSNTASQTASSVASPFASIASVFTNFTQASFITRVVLVLLGVILVGAAVFAFAKPNISLGDISKVATLAA